MPTVYVAFEGRYEDRACIGVFSSREAAVECAGPDPYDVEEHELDGVRDLKFGPIWVADVGLDDGEIHDQSLLGEEPRHPTKVRSTILGPYYRREPCVRGRSPVSPGHALETALAARARWLAMAQDARPAVRGSDSVDFPDPTDAA